MQLLVFISLILFFGAFLWRKRIDGLYVVILTFFSTIFFCTFHTLLMAFKDVDFSIEWLEYNFLFPAVIFIFPITISVIVFRYLIKKYIIFKHRFLQLSIQFLGIFFIVQACLACWAISDMQFLDFNYEFTYFNVLHAYRYYLDFMPASFLIPASIIYLDSWYEKRRKSKANIVVAAEENKS